MDASNLLLREGHRLLQVGVGLFLFTSFEGFAIPFFAVPLLGRSAHSLSALFGLMLIALGLSWPRLHLGPAAARIAFWFLIYSGFAITAAFVIAAIWGAGKSTMPLAGAPMGTPFQELVITAVAYSSAPTGIVAFALIFWGLRIVTVPPPGSTSDSQHASDHPPLRKGAIT
jgi:hydroxylaminobenzene mutase